MQCLYFLCHKNLGIANFPPYSGFTCHCILLQPQCAILEVMTKHELKTASGLFVCLFLNSAFFSFEVCAWKAGANLSNHCLERVSALPRVSNQPPFLTAEALQLLLKPERRPPLRLMHGISLLPSSLAHTSNRNRSEIYKNENKYIQMAAPRSGHKSSTLCKYG